MDQDFAAALAALPKRQRAIIVVTPEGILELLAGRAKCIAGVPRGASLHSVAYDFDTEAILLKVDHEDETLPPSSEGAMLFRIHPTFMSTPPEDR